MGSHDLLKSFFDHGDILTGGTFDDADEIFTKIVRAAGFENPVDLNASVGAVEVDVEALPRRICRFAVVDGVTSTYIHGMGSIGVIVKFNTDCADKDGFAEFAKNIALQAAAIPSTYVGKADVPASVIEEEKAILIKQMEQDPKFANKPAKVLEGIVTGKLGKFYEANCLMEQGYVKDDSMTVGKYVAATAKELGTEIAILDFVRYDKGEGIQKREDDLAAEVEKMVKGN